MFATALFSGLQTALSRCRRFAKLNKTGEGLFHLLIHPQKQFSKHTPCVIRYVITWNTCCCSAHFLFIGRQAASLCHCRVADWFAQLNNKMGGDLKKIRVVGEYMIEVWKAVGMDLDNVEFLWASDEINKRSAEYWTLVMDVAMKNNLKRIVRCSQIMGRGETEDLSAAQIFYPCMQCADIFFLKARSPALWKNLSRSISFNVVLV